VTRVDVSSTRVRDRLSAGLTVRYLVPGTIRDRLEEIWSERAVGAAVAASRNPVGLEKDVTDGC